MSEGKDIENIAGDESFDSSVLPPEERMAGYEDMKEFIKKSATKRTRADELKTYLLRLKYLSEDGCS